VTSALDNGGRRTVFRAIAANRSLPPEPLMKFVMSRAVAGTAEQRREDERAPSMQRGHDLRRPQVELGPERPLMEIGGLRAQLIRKMAIGAELGKPQVECRLAPEKRGNFHDRLAKSAALCGG
jgi:hypothetical protein